MLREQAGKAAAPSLVVVLHRMHGLEAEALAALLEQQVQHSVGLGVHATVAYTPAHQLAALLQFEAIQALVLASKLFLVRCGLMVTVCRILFPDVGRFRPLTTCRHSMHSSY